MAPKKQRYDKYYTLYADLSEEEVLRLKRYLRLDRVTALGWVTEQVKKYLRECDDHYELLRLGEPEVYLRLDGSEEES